eukprot:TRINITY_DN51467_c0_g1_i1.p1 TRINITY_DN51467_c0_g1~~TRINITY_DN51467_c0_g1_i1.p1  ORF type:complete len:306 (+),score=71.39 TRINITY_DN51467_c0_g1_i1:114-1031(+)
MCIRDRVPEDARIELIPLEEEDVVEGLSAGLKHSCVLIRSSDSQRVYSWGNRNHFGQLGGASTDGPEQQLVCVPIAGRNAGIATSATHSAVLPSCGNLLRMWGTNQLGQLSSPRSDKLFGICDVILGKEDIGSVTLGAATSFAVTRNGLVFACGVNNFGQLGLESGGGIVADFTPVKGLMRHTVRQVAAGAAHTLVLGAEGELWSCGRNQSGECGRGHSNPSQPLERVVLPDDKVASSIAAGQSSSFAIAEQLVYAWGKAESGVLGLPATSGSVRQPLLVGGLEEVVQLSVSSSRAVARCQDGRS